HIGAVGTRYGAPRGHDVYVEPVAIGQSLQFVRYYTPAEGLDINGIVPNIPLPVRAVNRMCGRPNTEIRHSFPVAAVVTSMVPRLREVRNFILFIAGCGKPLYETNKLSGALFLVHR